MKKLLMYLALSGMIIFISFKGQNIKVTKEPVIQIMKKNTTPKLAGDLAKFMSRLAKLESDNDSHAVNKYGHMGKYQFDISTLSSIGIQTTPDEFLNNPALQDSALIVYLKENKRSLSSVIKDFTNTTYNGIRITKSGVLAAAHFAGPIGVLSYFYPDDPRWSKGHRMDANGATVQLYLQKFANYNLGI